MSDYFIGLLTVPALATIYMLAVVVGSRILGFCIKSVHWAAFRLSPDNRSFQRKRLASACYGSESGFVLASGRLGIIFLYGKTDPERRAWADDQLADRFDLAEHLAERNSRDGEN